MRESKLIHISKMGPRSIPYHFGSMMALVPWVAPKYWKSLLHKMIPNMSLVTKYTDLTVGMIAPKHGQIFRIYWPIVRRNTCRALWNPVWPSTVPLSGFKDSWISCYGCRKRATVCDRCRFHHSFILQIPENWLEINTSDGFHIRALSFNLIEFDFNI